MMKHLTCLLMPLLALMSLAHAQIDVRLEPARHDYIVGENVALNLTIVNHTDSTISLGNRPGRPWLNFVINRRGENSPVSPFATPRFPDVKLTPGSKRSVQVNISDFYHLLQSGAYGATAVVRLTDSEATFSSNRGLFSLVEGGTVRSFKVRAGGKNLEMTVRLAHMEQHDNLFGQVRDTDTNRVVGACFLARYLNFMKPCIMLDSAQNLHVLCQSSPDFFTYAVMGTQGQRSHSQLYRRTAGPVNLISTGRGVQPTGVAPYVKPKPGQENLHKTSERPF